MKSKGSGVKVLAFTSCGHCPLALVKLQGKCKSMKVYCPLQRGEDETFKLVYETSYIGKLHEGCPLPFAEQWVEQYTALKDKVAFTERCNRVKFAVSYGQYCPSRDDLKEALPSMGGEDLTYYKELKKGLAKYERVRS